MGKRKRAVVIDAHGVEHEAGKVARRKSRIATRKPKPPPLAREEGDAVYLRLPLDPRTVSVAKRVVELLPDLERELLRLFAR